METRGFNMKHLEHLHQLIQERVSKGYCHDNLASNSYPIVMPPQQQQQQHQEQPQQQHYQEQQQQIPLSFIAARIGSSLSIKKIALGNTVLPTKQYDDSIFIPFVVPETKQVYISLFTMNENYRPTATLWMVDDNTLNSSNRLTGTSLGSGFEISAVLYSFKRYYLEVGIPKGSPSVSGPFKIIIGTDTYLSLMSNETCTFNGTEYKYHVTLRGDFIQVHMNENKTYRIGTFSTTMTPYYNKGERSVSYYFMGGDKCNNTPRGGKLVITSENENYKLKITSVIEAPNCFYTAFANSKYTWKYKAELQKTDI